jgi:hypothetical protein
MSRQQMRNIFFPAFRAAAMAALRDVYHLPASTPEPPQQSLVCPLAYVEYPAA